MGQVDGEALDMDLADMGGRNPYLIGYEQERKRRETQRTRSSRKEAGQIDMIWGTDIRETRSNASKVTPYDRGTASRGAGERQRGKRKADDGGRAALAEARAISGRITQAEESRTRTAGRRIQPAESRSRMADRRTQAEEGRTRTAGRRTQAAESRTRMADRRIQTAESRVQGGRRGVQAVGRNARAADRSIQPIGRVPQTVNRREAEKRRIQQQRRRAVLHKRIAIGIIEAIVVICLGIFVYLQLEKPRTVTNQPVAAQPENEPKTATEAKIQGISAEAYNKHPVWTEDFLTPNEYSRPGDPIGTVTNIFVHYTANPGTSAKQNRSYFEQLKDTHERGASAHFIIGYDGEIIQCVPLNEIAYAVQTRNYDSISIECCYKADNGSFTQETYDSLIGLLSWLTQTYGLDEQDILRHYDCGGKKCPIYYTENEDAWERLKKDVKGYEL